MQGYQINATVTRDDCCLIYLHATASTTSASAVESGGNLTALIALIALIVPTSPGRARIPNAYPPNRHRRR